jgi:nucleotide-binding universal stress UspA family protein
MVLGVDGSDASLRAVATLRAWPLLRGLPTQVVTVCAAGAAWGPSLAAGYYPAWSGGEPPTTASQRRDELLAAARGVADELLADGTVTTMELRDGDPAEQLIRTATAGGADIIAVGSRGLSTIPRLLLGSVARKVLLHAPQSVLVLKSARERVTRPEPVRGVRLVGVALA